MWELSRGHVDISLDKSRGAFIGKGQIKKEEEVRLTERTLFATFLFLSFQVCGSGLYLAIRLIIDTLASMKGNEWRHSTSSTGLGLGQQLCYCSWPLTLATSAPAVLAGRSSSCIPAPTLKCF